MILMCKTYSVNSHTKSYWSSTPDGNVTLTHILETCVTETVLVAHSKAPLVYTGNPCIEKSDRLISKVTLIGMFVSAVHVLST